MKRIAFMFSGHGAQYYRMGRELFDTGPMHRHWTHICDALARSVIGADLTEIIYVRRSQAFVGISRSMGSLINKPRYLWFHAFPHDSTSLS
jgi:acyl transferase domain-containing protein